MVMHAHGRVTQSLAWDIGTPYSCHQWKVPPCFWNQMIPLLSMTTHLDPGIWNGLTSQPAPKKHLQISRQASGPTVDQLHLLSQTVLVSLWHVFSLQRPP